MSLWLIAISFVIVWIAEGLGVADNFPLYGATGLLVTLVIFALLTNLNTPIFKRDIRKIVREELGKRLH